MGSASLNGTRAKPRSCTICSCTCTWGTANQEAGEEEEEQEVEGQVKVRGCMSAAWGWGGVGWGCTAAGTLQLGWAAGQSLPACQRRRMFGCGVRVVSKAPGLSHKLMRS